MKVLILGGNGVLGTELQKCGDVIALGRSECNVMDSDSVFDAVMSHNADIVINCAAVIDNRVIETISTHAVSVNIIGAANVSNVCNSLGIRYVYISTDYLYQGDRGNYKETDGLKFPGSIKQNMGQMQIELTLESVKINKGVDDKVFTIK